jgi:hypothetical protein
VQLQHFTPHAIYICSKQIFHPGAQSDGFHTPKDAIIRGKSSIATAQTWADTVVSGIVLFNDDQKTPTDVVLIGHTSPQFPDKISVSHTLYASDHWANGVVLLMPSIAILLGTENFMSNLSSEDLIGYKHLSSKTYFIRTILYDSHYALYRPWITSVHPRFISITGKPIVGDCILDHKMCSIIIRAINQFDRVYLYRNVDCLRHIFEVDFLVYPHLQIISP